MDNSNDWKVFNLLHSSAEVVPAMIITIVKCVNVMMCTRYYITSKKQSVDAFYRQWSCCRNEGSIAHCSRSYNFLVSTITKVNACVKYDVQKGEQQLKGMVSRTYYPLCFVHNSMFGVRILNQRKCDTRQTMEKQTLNLITLFYALVVVVVRSHSQYTIHIRFNSFWLFCLLDIRTRV